MEKRQPLQQMLLGKYLNIRPETEISAGKNKEYTGIYRHRQGLPK
jgi:hypothetical protein